MLLLDCRCESHQVWVEVKVLGEVGERLGASGDSQVFQQVTEKLISTLVLLLGELDQLGVRWVRRDHKVDELESAMSSYDPPDPLKTGRLRSSTIQGRRRGDRDPTAVRLFIRRRTTLALANLGADPPFDKDAFVALHDVASASPGNHGQAAGRVLKSGLGLGRGAVGG